MIADRILSSTSGPLTSTPTEQDRLAASLLMAPITIFVGHFGSGKSEIAVNLAFRLRSHGQATTLVDLDVVKPYFRSRGLIEDLEAQGVEVIAPRNEFAQADLPIVVPDVRAAVGRATAGLCRVIVDVGGADVGARVLGSIPGLSEVPARDTFPQHPAAVGLGAGPPRDRSEPPQSPASAGLAAVPPAEVLFVVNGNRPFADTTAAVVAMLREIERVSKLRVHGLVANTHLMLETTVDIVRQGIVLAESVGRAVGLAVRFCAVRAELADEVARSGPGLPLLALERHIMPPLDLRRRTGRRRSSIL